MKYLPAEGVPPASCEMKESRGTTLSQSGFLFNSGTARSILRKKKKKKKQQAYNSDMIAYETETISYYRVRFFQSETPSIPWGRGDG
ncbi:MAG: hypothetical protein VXY56_04210, partial [Pseudomonadota bacterium]|nr:hypothetical protein [Pseudomonadota bacterium]